MSILDRIAVYSLPGVPKVSAGPGEVAYIVGGALLLIGAVCIVYIIISSILYILAMGDAAKIKKAKDGILYAVVGLVLVCVSFFIVQFTIGIFK